MFEEPMLSRLNRLDNILRQLEDFRGDHHHHSSKSSSYASTTSSGALTSEGRPSFDSQPERLEKQCRPVSEVLMEVERKGTLIQRLDHAEDRILKLCLHLEEEFEGERSRDQLKAASAAAAASSNSPKKRLKQLVKSCVHPVKSKHKTNADAPKLVN